VKREVTSRVSVILMICRRSFGGKIFKETFIFLVMLYSSIRGVRSLISNFNNFGFKLRVYITDRSCGYPGSCSRCPSSSLCRRSGPVCRRCENPTVAFDCSAFLYCPKVCENNTKKQKKCH